MDKRSISWNIKKYRYFVKCNMEACAQLELDAIRRRITNRHEKYVDSLKVY